MRSWCEASATNSRWLVDEPLEPRAHLVERAREALLLGRALDRHAGGEVAVAEPGGGGVEPPQRPRDLARDQRAGAEAEQQHEPADRDEAEDRGAGGAADGLDALGDAHGALGAAGAQDRHGGGEDLLVERVGAALCPGRVRPRRAAAISGRLA